MTRIAPICLASLLAFTSMATGGAAEPRRTGKTSGSPWLVSGRHGCVQLLWPSHAATQVLL